MQPLHLLVPLHLQGQGQQQPHRGPEVDYCSSECFFYQIYVLKR
jgi:hypothetical protein